MSSDYQKAKKNNANPGKVKKRKAEQEKKNKKNRPLFDENEEVSRSGNIAKRLFILSCIVVPTIIVGAAYFVYLLEYFKTPA